MALYTMWAAGMLGHRELSVRHRGSFKTTVFLKVCSIPLTEVSAEIKLRNVLF